jgi:hypothetical protein
MLSADRLFAGGVAMTDLRKRMMEDMQLRGLSAKTQVAYMRSVRQLADHYGKSPEVITEEELRQYFLYLKNEKRVSRSTCTLPADAAEGVDHLRVGAPTQGAQAAGGAEP